MNVLHARGHGGSGYLYFAARELPARPGHLMPPYAHSLPMSDSAPTPASPSEGTASASPASPTPAGAAAYTPAAVPATTGPYAERETLIVQSLKKIYDPEIPMNIVDLGLVYGMEWKGDDVTLHMTLTSPGPLAAGILAEEIKGAIEKVPLVHQATVDMIWEPPWTPGANERIREAPVRLPLTESPQTSAGPGLPCRDWPGCSLNGTPLRLGHGRLPAPRCARVRGSTDYPTSRPMKISWREPGAMRGTHPASTRHK